MSVLCAAEMIIVVRCVDVTFNNQELQDVPVHNIELSAHFEANLL
jgi:hypothetical protein